MTTYSSPLFVFAHQGRTKILQTLAKESMHVTQLSNLLDMSNSEVSRHLAKLSEYKFIKKTKKYEITDFGLSSLELFGPMEFVFDNIDYFNTHSINILPAIEKRSLDVLKKSRMISGTGFMMIEFQKLIESTQEELQIMTDQPFPFGKENIKVNYIITPDFEHIDDRRSASDFNLKEVDFRFYRKMPLSMVIQDKKRGIILFPNTEGKIDYENGFYCDDDETIGYLSRLWNYYWKKAMSPQSLGFDL